MQPPIWKKNVTTSGFAERNRQAIQGELQQLDDERRMSQRSMSVDSMDNGGFGMPKAKSGIGTVRFDLGGGIFDERDAEDLEDDPVYGGIASEALFKREAKRAKDEADMLDIELQDPSRKRLTAKEREEILAIGAGLQETDPQHIELKKRLVDDDDLAEKERKKYEAKKRLVELGTMGVNGFRQQRLNQRLNSTAQEDQKLREKEAAIAAREAAGVSGRDLETHAAEKAQVQEQRKNIEQRKQQIGGILAEPEKVWNEAAQIMEQNAAKLGQAQQTQPIDKEAAAWQSMKPDERLAKKLQDFKLFSSLTQSIGIASDKSLKRRPDGTWDTPAVVKQYDNQILNTVKAGVTAIRAKTGLRGGGTAEESQAMNEALYQFQQENNLSDEEVVKAWNDFTARNNESWQDGEKLRVLSDGEIILNATAPEILDRNKLSQVIQSASAPNEQKARALQNLEFTRKNVAEQRMLAYEAAGVGIESPSEYAARTGRGVGMLNNPDFIFEYENNVLNKEGAVAQKARGLAADVVLGLNKLATTVLGAGAQMTNSETLGQMAAAGSEGGQVVGQGKPDTGSLGYLIQEAPSILAMVVASKIIAAAGAVAGIGSTAMWLISRAGSLTMAGGQSLGATYADERAQGKTHEEAEDIALRSGINTAIITEVFNALPGMAGFEKYTGGAQKKVADVTMREIFKSTSKQELASRVSKFARDKIFAGIGEGAEEGIDELTNAFINAKPDTNLSTAWQNAAESAKVGALIGTTVDVIGSTGFGAKEKADATLVTQGKAPITPEEQRKLAEIARPDAQVDPALAAQYVSAMREIGEAVAADPENGPSMGARASGALKIASGKTLDELTTEEINALGIKRDGSPMGGDVQPLVDVVNGTPVLLDAAVRELEGIAPSAKGLVSMTEGEARAKFSKTKFSVTSKSGQQVEVMAKDAAEAQNIAAGMFQFGDTVETVTPVKVQTATGAKGNAKPTAAATPAGGKTPQSGASQTPAAAPATPAAAAPPSAATKTSPVRKAIEKRRQKSSIARDQIVETNDPNVLMQVQDDKIIINPEAVEARAKELGLKDAGAAKWIDGMIDEEIRHIVQLRAARELHAESGSTEPFQQWLEARYKRIWQEEFVAKGKDGIVRQLYGPNLSKMPEWKRAMEGERMLWQQKYRGQVTEVARLWLDVGADVLENIRALLKQLKALVNSGELSGDFKADIARLEAKLKEIEEAAARRDAVKPFAVGETVTGAVTSKDPQENGAIVTGVVAQVGNGFILVRPESGKPVRIAFADVQAVAPKAESKPKTPEQAPKWVTFDASTGTLGIPRAEMPQIKAEDRSAMVQFLKARGIDYQEENVAAGTLKPTQAEYSPAKVQQARDYEGGNRAILVSADNYVVDGHHQWLAADGGEIRVIRLMAPIQQVLDTVKQMPSATTDEGGKAPSANKGKIVSIGAVNVGDSLNIDGAIKVVTNVKRDGDRTEITFSDNSTINGNNRILDVYRVNEATPTQPEAETHTFYTPNPDASVIARGTVKIVSAAELERMVLADVSANQARLRTGQNANSAAQVAKIAADPKPQLLLGVDSSVSEGAPTVYDGQVLAGNGRSMGIIAAYKGGTAESYKQEALAKAKQLGIAINPAITDPVLIRSVTRFEGGTAQDFADQSNSQGMLGLSAVELAKIDAQVLGDFASVETNEAGDFTAATIRDVAAAFDKDGRNKVTRETNGQPNAKQVADRIRNAALAGLFEKAGKPMTDLLGVMESDEGARLVSIIAANASRFMALDNDLSLATELTDALIEVQSGIRAVAAGTFKTLREWQANQGTELIGRTDITDAGLWIAGKMVDAQRKPSILKEIFAEYLNNAETEQQQRDEAEQSNDIFGEQRQPQNVLASLIAARNGGAASASQAESLKGEADALSNQGTPPSDAQVADLEQQIAEVEQNLPSNQFNQQEYTKRKRALRKAINAKDWATVIKKADEDLAYFEQTGYPDDWSMWERAKEDAQNSISPRSYVEPITKPLAPSSKIELTDAEKKLKAASEGLFASDLSSYSENIPVTRMPAMIDAATAMIESGIETPQGMANSVVRIEIEANKVGALRRYSESIWSMFRAVKNTLQKDVAWPSIYAKADAENGIGETPADKKQAEEQRELEMVMAARGIVQGSGTREQKYNELVNLYESMPAFNTKTSTSKINQAFSTPAPLAYAAAMMAGPATGSVYDSAAGHAMLLVDVSDNNSQVVVNELDPRRLERLRQVSPNWTVTNEDATTQVLPEKVNQVRINPPFGSITLDDGSKKVFSTPMGETTQIDHAIVLQTLSNMDKNGRAVLIIGGPPPIAQSEKGRRDFYSKGNAAKFFAYLHENFNVIDHVTVNGDLYKKQGAGWPVDVILIDGKNKSRTALPSAKVPTMLNTWAEIYQHSQIDDNARITSRKITEAEVRAGLRDAAAELEGVRGQRNPSGNDGPPSIPNGRPDENKKPSAGVSGGTNDAAPGSAELQANGENAAPQGNDESGESGIGSGRPRGDNQTVSRGNRKEVAVTKFQTEYVPFSSDVTLGTLVPTNMADAVNYAFGKIQSEVGDLKSFVKNKLGYQSGENIDQHFAGEQIDALAAAIWNFEKGGALIVGDQTGIGKGRIAAGLMRYAIQQGLIPVFVTEKHSLLSGMYRSDIVDIGADKIIKPACCLSDLEKFKEGKKNKLPYGKKYFESVASTGKLSNGANAIFTLYSQIQADTSKNADKKTKERAKRDKKAPEGSWRTAALTRIAPNAVFILDESHNAAGASLTGYRMAEIMEKSKRAYYSSATSVKRPENMGIYFKTNIGKVSNGSMDKLVEIMDSGGVPAMQLASYMLAMDGQYLRRERSFEGINFSTKINLKSKERDDALADNLTYALRQIVTVQDQMQQVADIINSRINGMAKNAKIAAGNRDKLETANFSSKTHNVVSQYLLAIKCNSAVDEAMRLVKSGKKVVVGLSNTMESAIVDLQQFANDPNTEFTMTYKGLIMRYLDKMRTITTGKGEQKEEFVITNTPNPKFASAKTDQLFLMASSREGQGEDAVITINQEVVAEILRRYMWEAYENARNEVRKVELGDMPLSPIDYMRQAMEERGVRTGEITGRSLGIDVNGEIYERTKAEKDSISNIDAFNDEDLDFLVINQSGATGINLHAGEKMKNKKPRAMIVVQPPLDINTFMQMLGRIHRSGQVTLPEFILLQTALPAEFRPAAILAVKMAMLNANTTSNAKSDVSEGNKVTDLFNKYGDQVVYAALERDPDLQRQLAPFGSIFNKIIDGDKMIPFQDAQEVLAGAAAGDIARSITGFLAILPVEEQQIFWDKITQEYNALIDYLNEMGQNDLESKALELKSKTISKEVFTGGTSGDSVFEEPSFVETVETAIGKQPITGAKAVEITKEARQTGIDVSQGYYASATKKIDERIAAAKEKALKWSAEKESKMRADMIENRNVISNALRMLGTMGTVKREDGSTGLAVVESVKMDMEKPFAPGSQIFTLQVNDGRRSIKISAAKLKDAFNSQFPSASEWDNTTFVGSTRNIVTGNLLAAIDKLKGTGQIISYTTDSGETKMGVLLPAGFTKKAEAEKARTRNLKTMEDFSKAFADGAKVSTVDKAVRLLPIENGVEIRVPASRSAGGKYWTKPALNALMNTGEFLQIGGDMRASFPMSRLQDVVDNIGEPFIAVEKLAGKDDDGDTALQASDLAPTPPPFYSQLSRVIDQKMPASANAGQVMQIAMQNAKAEEVKWSGLQQALVGMQDDKGKVSKADVLKYLADEGAVRFEEVVMGSGRKIIWAEPNAKGIIMGSHPSGSFRIMPDGDGFTLEKIGSGSSTHPTVDSAKKAAKALEKEGNADDAYSGVKYSGYTLPGGENYREVMLAMPAPKETMVVPHPKPEIANRLSGFAVQFPNGDYAGGNERPTFWMTERSAREGIEKYPNEYKEGYTSSHFPDVPNYVAHMRMNEREDASGKLGLFIEELQSDRHQEGRKKGYRDGQSAAEFLQKMGYDTSSLSDSQITNEASAAGWSGIADAPYRKDWPLALFKRALRDAVEGGKEWIGWTTGDTQNDRFDLSKQVQGVIVDPTGNGNFSIQVKPNGRSEWEVVERDVPAAKLPDIIGKELAEKVNPENRSQFEGQDLKVGGSGMKGFYDNMLPKEIGKYVKQWGGKVAKAEIAENATFEVIELKIRSGPQKGGVEYVAKNKNSILDKDNPIFPTKKEAENFIASKGGTAIWRIDITPEMRKGVEAGQALFASDLGGDDLFSMAEKRQQEQPTKQEISAFAFTPEAGNTMKDVKAGRMNALLAYRALTTKRNKGSKLTAEEEQQLLDAETALGQKMAFDMDAVRSAIPAQPEEPERKAPRMGQVGRGQQQEMLLGQERLSSGQMTLFASDLAPYSTRSKVPDGTRAFRFPGGILTEPTNITLMASDLEAWHGTPHKVDRFRKENIGTGEGAQAYGHGLYFAGTKKVAEQYRQDLSGYNELVLHTSTGKKKGAQLDDIDLEVAKYLESGERAAGQYKHNTVYYAKQKAEAAGLKEVVARLDKYGRDAKATYEKNIGNIYRVQLKVDDEQLLDWDKPLSEQSEKVQQSFRAWLGKDKEAWEAIKNTTGSAWYGQWENSSSAKFKSETLLGMGIKGIRYLDGNSRPNPAWPRALQVAKDNLIRAMSGNARTKAQDIEAHKATIADLEEKLKRQGTYNYVIFDDNDIEILEENGQPVSKRERAALFASDLSADDAAYMAAVEAGDMETAQRMVDEAAKKAGYTIRGARIGFYVDGVPLQPSGGDLNFVSGYFMAEGADRPTSNQWSVSKTVNLADLITNDLRPEQVQQRSELVAAKASRILQIGGIGKTQLTPQEEALIQAEIDYQLAVNNAYWKFGIFGKPENYDSFVNTEERIAKARGVQNVDSRIISYGRDLPADSRETGSKNWKRALYILMRDGKIQYDAVRGIGGRTAAGEMASEFVVPRPNQIKSVEAVVKDANGNVIPLSQRFNPSSDSILYASDMGDMNPDRIKEIKAQQDEFGNAVRPGTNRASVGDEATRKVIDVFDIDYEERRMTQTRDQWVKGGQEKAAKNRKALIENAKLLAEGAPDAVPLTPADIVGTQIVIEQMVQEAGDNFEKLMEAGTVIQAYRKMRGDVARVLASGWDRMMKPAERHRRFLANAILTLPTKVAAEIDRSYTPEEARKVIRKEITDRLRKIERALNDMGVTVDEVLGKQFRLSPDKRNILKDIVKDMSKAEQRAMQMHSEHVPAEKIMKETGLSRPHLEQLVKKSYDDALARMIEKVRAGMTAENAGVSASALMASPLGMTEEEIIAEAKKLVELGLGLSPKLHTAATKPLVKRTRKPESERKAIEVTAEQVAARWTLRLERDKQGAAKTVKKSNHAELVKLIRSHTKRELVDFKKRVMALGVSPQQATLLDAECSEARARAKMLRYENVNKPQAIKWARPEFNNGLIGYEFADKDLVAVKKLTVALTDAVQAVGKVESLAGPQRARAEAMLAKLDEILAKYGTSAVEVANSGKPLESYRFDIEDPTHVHVIANAIMAIDADFVDKAVEYNYFSLLSGPQTFLKNATSIFYSVWDATIARGFEIMMNAFLNNPMNASLGETKYILRAMGPMLSRAKTNFIASFGAEMPFFEQDILGVPPDLDNYTAGVGSYHRTAISGQKGRFLRIPTRALLATDDYVKTINACAEVGAMAYRICRAAGLKPESAEFDQRMKQLVNVPGSMAWRLASEKAYRRTFTNTLPGQKDQATGQVRPVRTGGEVIGMLVGKTQSLLSTKTDKMAAKVALSAIRLMFFPFVKVPYNIIATSLTYTPLSLIEIAQLVAQSRGIKNRTEKMKAQAEIIERATRTMQGTMLAALVMGALGEGDDDDLEKPLLITGSRPFSDTKAGVRETGDRLGIGPYTISWPMGNGKRGTFNYGGIEPLATILGTTVDASKEFKQAMKGRQTYSEALSGSIGSFASQISEKSFMQGVGDLYQLWSGKQDMTRFTADMLGRIVPNIIKQPARELDPYARAKTDELDKAILYAMFPVGQKEAKADIYGEPVKKGGFSIARILDFTDAQTKDTRKVDEMMWRYMQRHPGKDELLAPSDPQTTYTGPDGKTVKMTDAQARMFRELAGKQFDARVKSLALNYENPTELDMKKVREAAENARSIAKKILRYNPNWK